MAGTKYWQHVPDRSKKSLTEETEESEQVAALTPVEEQLDS